MAKTKKNIRELKMGEITPIEMAGKIIKREFKVDTILEALQARIILREALRDFSDVLAKADEKLDDIITTEAVKSLGDAVTIDVEGRAKYTYKVEKKKSVKLHPNYARNEDLYKDHPELVDKKETTIYSLRKDIDTTVDGAIMVDEVEVITESARRKK